VLALKGAVTPSRVCGRTQPAGSPSNRGTGVSPHLHCSPVYELQVSQGWRQRIRQLTVFPLFLGVQGACFIFAIKI
jgi:hypothetical protein